jgi:hypothetical protein
VHPLPNASRKKKSSQTEFRTAKSLAEMPRSVTPRFAE